MTGYVASLLMGLAVGLVYGLVQVRSPAPPLIALVGPLGMVLGEQAVGLVKHHLSLPASISDRKEYATRDVGQPGRMRLSLSPPGGHTKSPPVN